MIRIHCPICNRRIPLTVTGNPAEHGNPQAYERRREYHCAADGTWVIVDLARADDATHSPDAPKGAAA